MDKWKARFLKTAGGTLQLGAAALLLISGGEGSLAAACLAAATGLAGLLLWGAGARAHSLRPAEARFVDHERWRLEERLLALQDEVARLHGDREWYGELNAASGEGSKHAQGTLPVGMRHDFDGG
jgi:hypothetical protein